MDKVKSSRINKKERKNKRDKKRKACIGWIILTLGYAGFLMWVSGMTQAYFPSIIGLGAGQYIDLQIGLIVISTSIYFILSAWFLKKFNK